MMRALRQGGMGKRPEVTFSTAPAIPNLILDCESLVSLNFPTNRFLVHQSRWIIAWNNLSAYGKIPLQKA